MEIRGDETKDVDTLNRGVSGFATPIITQPANLQWTQVIPQANGYKLGTDGNIGNLVVTSDQAAHTIGFIFNVIHKAELPDPDYQVLTATIRLFGDNAEIKSYTFQARPVGEVSEPISVVKMF